MKIIKHKPDFYIMKCLYCDCVFSYTLEELKAEMFELIVNCPECNTPSNHNGREKEVKVFDECEKED